MKTQQLNFHFNVKYIPMNSKRFDLSSNHQQCDVNNNSKQLRLDKIKP